MPLLQILTDPQNFRFYQGGQGYTSNDGTFGQKSIKYGNDRFHNASSKQPYITVGIPENLSFGTTDFLLRGGINVVRDTAADVSRLTKMFFDTDSLNGLFFTTKQELLSRIAVRTQASGDVNGGIYSPLNTLAQAGVVAYGGHLNKQGITPFGDTGAYSDNKNLYFNVVKPNPNNPSESLANNRLVELLRLTSNKENGIRKNGVTLNNGKNVMTYTGGPGSELGVGSTSIRYSSTSKTLLTLAPNQVNNLQIYSDTGENEWTYSSKLISTPYYSDNSINSVIPSSLNTSPNKQGSIASPKIQDFRKVLRKNLSEGALKGAENSGATPLAPDYVTGSFEIRTNIGDPGQRSGKSYADYSKGVIDLSKNQSVYGSVDIPDLGPYKTGLDKITSVPLYRSNTVSYDNNLNDLVQFRIATISNNDPNYKVFMHFRAFLGPMSDTYNADWNPFKYLGRGENFYTYNGFTRQISLSWTVAAQSKQELIPMYQKLNYLASSLAPDYSPQGYMRGNLAEITVGSYIVDQPGIITGLTYDIQEDTPWEIGINTNGNLDPDSPQMPHIIRVTGFNFIPIQKFVARKQQLSFSKNGVANTTIDDTGIVSQYGIEQYISLNNTSSYGTSLNTLDQKLILTS